MTRRTGRRCLTLKKRQTAVILAAALGIWPLCGFGPASVFADGKPLNVNDASAAEQWALFNDGTFSMSEVNRYPVYTNPFGNPAGDSELLGVLVGVKKKQAKAGADINIGEAWDRYGNGNRDAVVAVIDTGIDPGHEDLKDALWVNKGEIPDNGVDDDGNGYVDDVHGWNFYGNNNQIFAGAEDGHGTHGAGTIRAGVGNGVGVAGIVPGNRVSIMALKALGGEDGNGSTASVIKAIRYAEDNGAVICNLSLTSAVNDAALYEAMENSSMLFVVAAGNGNPKTGRGVNTDITPFYPAAYDLDNVISVANLEFDGTLHKTSNYGLESVDLAAPGTYILSTTPGNSYGYMTGTSMAAPMVTGAAAMVYSYFDGISVADVKEILLSTVTPMESLRPAVKTGGMLNVGAALSFDLGKLSGSGFSKGGKRPENGTAPYMEAKQDLRRDGTYLKLRVLDIDGDLDTLLYARGSHTAEEFEDGRAEGIPFHVSEKDISSFRIEGTADYTFYARDKKGNRTVKALHIADMSEGPGANP